ncbi:hypothetical protein [Pseudomonas yamanorum]
MSKPTGSDIHAGNVSARAKVSGQIHTINTTNVTVTHTPTEWRYAGSVFLFQPPPSGVYGVQLAIPPNTPAGIHPFGPNSNIRAFYEMPKASLLNAYQAVSGSIHLKTDPTPTTLEADFHFIGRSPAVSDDAEITDGTFSLNTEAHHIPSSHGHLKVHVDLNSLPSEHTEISSTLADKFVFDSNLVYMRPALGAPFLEIKSIYLPENAEIYIFIPNDKLETAQELDIKDDESGEYAIAILRRNGYFYRASIGRITYTYDAKNEVLKAKFHFQEGKDNNFSDGALEVSGLE